MTNIDHILDQIDTLPALPTTSVKIVSIIGNPNASVGEIVEAIKYDQALTGEVLRLCNSAYFGLSRQITSLNDAMVCLGTLKLLQLVMAVHTNGILNQPQAGYGLEGGMLWRQSVATAIAAAEFAKAARYPNVNLAFTAGLLQGIGKLVLSSYVAKSANEILRLVDEEHKSFDDAEKAVLGSTHSEIGALVAERWKLPEVIVRSIRHQHDPSALSPPDTLVDIVHLALCTVLLMGISLGTDGLCYRADESVMARHGLTHADLEVVGMNMCTELQRLAALQESPSVAVGASS
ncbi:MAG: HDOD domain-containing protein [Phycisphaerales bacterium]|nr:HDOD domain-containing protein [Phycisphaerales bacterium]